MSATVDLSEPIPFGAGLRDLNALEIVEGLTSRYGDHCEFEYTPGRVSGELFSTGGDRLRVVVDGEAGEVRLYGYPGRTWEWSYEAVFGAATPAGVVLSAVDGAVRA